MEKQDCENVLKTTEQMAEAIHDEDMEKLAAALEARQQCLNRLSAQSGALSSEQKKVLARALVLDKQLMADTRVLLERYRGDIRQHEIKAKSMRLYQNSLFDLSQGQLMDRKR